MKFVQNFSFVLILVMVVVSAASCRSSDSQAVNGADGNQPSVSRNMNESTASNVEIKTDIEGLEKLINLPVRPQEVRWTAEVFDNSKGAVPGPTDYRLTALLKYDDEGAAELVRKLMAETAEKMLGKADVKLWFPDEVKNETKTVDDRKFLEGAKYPPDSFLRSAYRNGSLIRIGETNYFVLNLFSF